MHRTAFAAACASRLAVDLGHHFLHVDALGDAMAVPSVGGGDSVAIVEMHHDAGGRGFFTCVEMNESRDVAAREIDVQTLLEFADRAHHAVRIEELLLAQWKRVVAHEIPPSWRLKTDKAPSASTKRPLVAACAMQALTSIVRKAASLRMTRTSSSCEKVTSRSPSNAREPAGAAGVIGVCNLIVSTRWT